MNLLNVTPPRANPPLERDRLPALPAGALRGFAAPAAPQLARWAPDFDGKYAYA